MPTPHIFGVRHLSPAAAWHLRQLLDRVRPKLVLIEGSDDADELIPHIVSPKSKLPIAILAYTTDAPVRTFVYPLAIYSPEYQALIWAQENKAKARFMDLPSSVFLVTHGRCAPHIWCPPSFPGGGVALASAAGPSETEAGVDRGFG